MKKINILIPLIIVIVIISNVYYYLNTYHLQVNFQKNFLLKQTQISGYEIEKTGQDFMSDLNFILFSENIHNFFTDPVAREEVSRKIEIFYTKYQSLISGIALYDDHRNAFTFYKDDKNKRISNIFITREQKELYPHEKIIRENGKYAYYLPVFTDNRVTGNIVVKLDYNRFINTVFEKSHLGDIQWQWILDEEGNVLFSNLETDSLRILELNKIAQDISNGFQGALMHKMYISGKETTVISAYYPTNFLGREFGIVFSLQTDIILRNIITNALILASLTLLLILLIIILFVLFIRRQREEEREIKRSEENLRKILSKLPIGVMVIDRQRKVLFINERARSTFSVTQDPPDVGKRLGEWFFVEHHDEIKALDGLNVDSRNFLILRRDDAEWVLLREEIPILFQGQEATLYAIIDVTPLEKARRREAAAVKAKTELMLTMSEEIRLPLGKILEKTRELLESGERPDPSFLEEIRFSTDLLLAIVEDMLEFSRIEAGKMMIEEIPFRLRKELKLVFNKHKPAAKKKNLHFYTIFEENIPDNFIGDPFKIRQVLTRLIENAIRYTDEGEVRIRVFMEQKKDRNVLIGFEISDTGRGLSPEHLSLFNSKEVSPENKAIAKVDKQGGGLGIAITIQLIEMLNGEIRFRSPAVSSDEHVPAPGGPGTTVTVRIPLFLDEKYNKEVNTEQVTSYSQIRVLLIKDNDNDDSDAYIRDYLKHFGVQTTLNFYMDKTVHLIEHNANKPPARYHILIIKDSPTFDGFALLKELHEKGLTRKFLILVISSNDQKGNYARARKWGADYYLIDPVQGSELFNILQDNFPHIRPEQTSDLPLEEISRDKKILVAEDNLVNQKMMQGFFKNLGFEIDIANDGEEAVEMATRREYDLILMDVMMPNMDGWEATEALRKRGINTPIVAVTADVTEEAERRSRSVGMNDYLTKPVRSEDIKKLLIRWLSSKRNEGSQQ